MNDRPQDHLSFPAIVVVLSLVAIGALAREPLGNFASSLLHGVGEKSGGVPELLPKLPDGRQRAFPTAEGFGASARGGREGQVFFVTNTRESGKGSLRACLEAIGPRNCVFRTSGTIVLTREPLVIRNPFITIAGETAPGDGISIRNGPRQIERSLQIKSHDVIIRHLRIRPGPNEVEACCSGAIGLYEASAKKIIIDHVSASWGSDETVASESATDFTFQWCLISEPLLNGGPGKRNRARNMLLAKGRNISVHHNLFAFGKFRSPQIEMSGTGAVASVVNNVMYSPIWQYVLSLSDKWASVQANVLGNYKVAGTLEDFDDHLLHLFPSVGNGYSIFVAGNIDETYRPDDEAPDELVIAPESRGYLVDRPVVTPTIRSTSAVQAYIDVLAGAGATRPARDAVDNRTIDLVRERSGTLLKGNPEKVGGWPELASTIPPADTDGDGMHDAWERTVGLNAADADDGRSDADGDGWTNLEEYFHELAGDGRGMAPARADEASLR